MRMQITMLFWFIMTASIAQEATWVDQKTIVIDEQSVWCMDVMSAIYVADKDVLSKYDTAGVKMYSQSTKSLGRISKIASVNSFRLMLFSEDQQSVAFTDNTLTSIQSLINLTDLGFAYVTLVATSSQPNKLWIFDQLNSKLTLFDFNNSDQKQEIENLNGLLRSKEINWMEEKDNKLYLGDSENNLYVFDRYGSLINVLKLPSNTTFILYQENVLLSTSTGISEYDIEKRELFSTQLPFYHFQRMAWVEPFLIIQDQGKLIKYKRILQN